MSQPEPQAICKLLTRDGCEVVVPPNATWDMIRDLPTIPCPKPAPIKMPKASKSSKKKSKARTKSEEEEDSDKEN